MKIKRTDLRPVYNAVRAIANRLDEFTCTHKDDHSLSNRWDPDAEEFRVEETYYCIRCGRISYVRICSNSIEQHDYYRVWAGRPRRNWYWNRRGF